MSDSEYSDNEKVLSENEEDDDISLDNESVSDDGSIENFEDENKIIDDEENINDEENTDDDLNNEKKNELININDDNLEDDDYDDDDDEDENEQKYQKFDEEQKKKIIDEYYSDYYTHNYDEVVAMSSVVRDENNNIIDPFHKTVPIITKYEIARILGVRTKQINSGSSIYVKTNENIIDGYYIALQELKEKKIPFIIRRPIPGGKSEYWNVSDLELLEAF
jgi:DNA-directed RNA polymerase subunit K/omega